MITEAAKRKDRYRALPGRAGAAVSKPSSRPRRPCRAPTSPPCPAEDGAEARPAGGAVDDMYRHAHSIRGAAGTLGIEPAREAADILAEVALHLTEQGASVIPRSGISWPRLPGTAAIRGSLQASGAVDAAACAAPAALRADFERRFVPPQDAADDFAEVARVLRLTDEDIAAFRFPTSGTSPAAAAAAVDVALASPSPIVPALPPAVEVLAADGEGVRDLAGEAAPAVAPEMAQPAPSYPMDPSVMLTTPVALGPAAQRDDLAALDPATDSLAVYAGDGADEDDDSGHRWEEDLPLANVVPSDLAATAPAPGQRIVAIFCESGLRMLEAIPSALADLRADRWDLEAMRVARRVFHTIKGDARQMGFDGLAGLAEAAEDVFDAVFDARTREPDLAYGLPEAAYPLLVRAHSALLACLERPAGLADGTARPDPALVAALGHAAALVGGPASLPALPERSAAEERRKRLLPAFLTESRQIIDTLHAHVAALRADPMEIAPLLGGTRALHTLKGNAASMLFDTVAQLTGAGEALFEHVAVTGEPISAAQLDLLGDLEAALRHLIDAADFGEATSTDSLAPLLAALAAAPATTAPRGRIGSLSSIRPACSRRLRTGAIRRTRPSPSPGHSSRHPAAAIRSVRAVSGAP